MRNTVTVIVGLVAISLVVAGCGGVGDGAGGGSDDSTGEDLSFSTSGWDTDFSEHSVSLSEFVSGGPGKDGIPAIDDPRFVSVGDADEFLDSREPVAVLELKGTTRAYPLQILTWHEIVNDEIADRPVAVTYCPLCNSTVAFTREVDGRVLDFGTTGNLRNNDLVMYDRQTESWWQQITAEAVVGELTGTKLEVIPSQILSWEEFMRLQPDGEVLSRDTGFGRAYGENPYVLYDSTDRTPYPLAGEGDDSLPAKERVAAVKTGERSAVVYPFSRLEEDAPVNDEIDGRPVVVFFDPEVGSALDAPTISQSRRVGAAAVFSRDVAGRTLTFEAAGESGRFRDRETGSNWEMNGESSSGPLAGERLEQVASDDQFWFALAAFFSDADIRG